MIFRNFEILEGIQAVLQQLLGHGWAEAGGRGGDEGKGGGHEHEPLSKDGDARGAWEGPSGP